ncbi:hypothetical protein IFM89_020879 [Coptis chinensis]|uniref:Gfo/Idh/MocA-like oxidoreductase N-terminal domain-containing protein n=1 Tax=Coptis chinensis TaxID=261450 RepID=A0A835IXP4_9MAGN|nr:hypothetical protein IFM89_020879 [Coptis chinensis]
MTENSIKFGILGCAQIARKVSRAIHLSPNSTLYAIGSRSIEKANKFAADNGFPETVKIYGSYNEVLNDPDVDAVYMPLPTTLHVHWGVLAAEKKKHLLLEKPTALSVADLDLILEACRANGVQFMDGSMWLHHPRTAKMKDMLRDTQLFGQLNSPDLDSLGALGDVGWYCIGAILWATDYKLPKTVCTLPKLTCNQQGVILACGASFDWGEDGKAATFYCSFLSNVSMDLVLYGTNGSIHLEDFTIPYEESSASCDLSSGANFAELQVGWTVKPVKVQVASELPQEALMVQEFARLVENIKKNGKSPDGKWPEISRKTQLVLDAVGKSIELGCKPVDI